VLNLNELAKRQHETAVANNATRDYLHGRTR
jgi:hypothetical protein